MSKEIEKKWFVRIQGTFAVEKIQRIRQNYLRTSNGEKRVRRIHANGKVEHFYTHKKEISPGVREEKEYKISFFWYWILRLVLGKPGQFIQKTRTTFMFEGNTFELDVFAGKHTGLKLLECEVSDEELLEKIEIPTGFDLEDVTSDKRFSNAVLAREGVPR